MAGDKRFRPTPINATDLLKVRGTSGLQPGGQTFDSSPSTRIALKQVNRLMLLSIMLGLGGCGPAAISFLTDQGIPLNNIDEPWIFPNEKDGIDPNNRLDNAKGVEFVMYTNPKDNLPYLAIPIQNESGITFVQRQVKLLYERNEIGSDQIRAVTMVISDEEKPESNWWENPNERTTVVSLTLNHPLLEADLRQRTDNLTNDDIIGSDPLFSQIFAINPFTGEAITVNLPPQSTDSEQNDTIVRQVALLLTGKSASDNQRLILTPTLSDVITTPLLSKSPPTEPPLAQPPPPATEPPTPTATATPTELPLPSEFQTLAEKYGFPYKIVDGKVMVDLIDGKSVEINPAQVGDWPMWENNYLVVKGDNGIPQLRYVEGKGWESVEQTSMVDAFGNTVPGWVVETSAVWDGELNTKSYISRGKFYEKLGSTSVALTNATLKQKQLVEYISSDGTKMQNLYLTWVFENKNGKVISFRARILELNAEARYKNLTPQQLIDSFMIGGQEEDISILWISSPSMTPQKLAEFVNKNAVEGDLCYLGVTQCGLSIGRLGEQKYPSSWFQDIYNGLYGDYIDISTDAICYR